MSQRSHIAHSGSSAISECSAACSDPSSRGICSSPSSIHGSGQEPDRLGLELGLRQVERDELEALLRLDRLLLVADDLLGDDDRAEGELQPEPPLGRAAARRSRWSSRSSPACSSRRENGSTSGGARLEVERAHAVALAEVEVDRALVHGREGALLLDDPEHRAAGGVDDRERLGAGRAQRDARGRVVAAGPDVARLRVLRARGARPRARAPRRRAPRGRGRRAAPRTPPRGRGRRARAGSRGRGSRPRRGARAARAARA